MATLIKIASALGILAAIAYPAYPQKAKPASDGPTTLIITFKDGHQQTFSMADIAHVQYVGESDAYLTPEYFLGKWEVGDGNSGTFLIALESNGEARKTLGASQWHLDS